MGAPPLYMELGSPGWLSLLLPFQLPLPLMELMETEVLDILKKALSSEHPLSQLTQKIMVAWGCGVSGYVCLARSP